MDAVTRTVIEAGIMAPSGENAQPWRFSVSEHSIILLHAPESDRSLYNYNGWGTLVAHGAALENMYVRASAEGYDVVTTLFPNGTSNASVAEIKFIEAMPDPENRMLAESILARCTNRRPYRKESLPQEIDNAIDEAAQRFSKEGISLIRFSDADTLRQLAEIGSANERIMLGNRELHDFFFSHVTWSAQEDERIRGGFYIKTLELSAPVQKLFKLLAYWPMARALRALGFPVLVGKGNAQTYAASAEIGVITVPELSAKYFVNAGRLLERIWLTLTSHGASLQPLTGTLFMGLFATHVPEGHFSGSERELLQRHNEVLSALTKGSGIPVLMYRAGYASAPTARSRRYDFDLFIV